MTNTYTWAIESLDCIPSVEGQTNVVSTVHWRCKKSDGTYSTEVYGAQPLTYTEGSPFTPYSGLTQDTVIHWVQSAMGAEQVAAIQTNLDNQIANLVNPPIVTPNLPWSN